MVSTGNRQQLALNFVCGDPQMNDEELQHLCLSLMQADTENQVIEILTEAGYWDNDVVWRYYGDYENNYNTIGNQMSSPDAALVEKLINSVDARLMNECLMQGIDPEGPNAPSSIRDAVAHFFESDLNPSRTTAGLVREWSDSKRTDVARGITLCATGYKPALGNPSFTIADCGEGQTPERMPQTFLSLTKSNKLRIPFVQGKFNMGSTGVLKFCGQNGIQLILTRRNPKILDNGASLDDSKWAFTIVRREYPIGNRRSSVYTYLAPIGADKRPKQGKVLHFAADTMPIFPQGQQAYSRPSEHGTLIKLFEYGTTSKTHMFRHRGIQSNLDLLLPDLALPIRLHECRDYEGHVGSFETTLTGLRVRLEDDKANNLEFVPSSAPLRVMNEDMMATIYAFKKDAARTYRGQEGIIFTVNGQTHGHLSDHFFARNNVGLRYLQKDILVVVDCSMLSGKAREDLFMNSRDRLSDGSLRKAVEEELEDLLKTHPGLRELKNRRRQEEIAEKVDDSKPLEDVLKTILKCSPTLSTLFLRGTRLSTPFKTDNVKESNEPFDGQKYPSFFKFKGKEYGKVLRRNSHINLRCRITFETNADNDYFTRTVDPGEFSLFRVSGEALSKVEDRSMNLHDGAATLSLRLPANCKVGDTLHFRAVVTDRTRIEPFSNDFVVSVIESGEVTGGAPVKRGAPGNQPGTEREIAAGIALPNIIPVYEAEWRSKEPPFDQFTALRVKQADTALEEGANGQSRSVYDFYVNMDNIYLKTELKSKQQDSELVRAQFKYGMVLIGLGLLHEKTMNDRPAATDPDAEDANQQSIEDQIEVTTRAVAPILLPMIDALGGLEITTN